MQSHHYVRPQVSFAAYVERLPLLVNVKHPNTGWRDYWPAETVVIRVMLVCG